MMLRKRSSRWARAKALYVLPLACLALGAFAQTSYVLPEDKTTKNSGNGEMPLPAGADGLTVGTPEGGMPPVEGSMAELLANLRRTALEKQTAESGRTPLPDAYLAGTISLGPVMSLFAAAAGGL